MSPLRRCMPTRHKRYVILPIHSSGATRTRRDDAMSSIHPLLLHPWVCSLCGSCLLHVLMRLFARVSSWRCYPRMVSFHLLNTVAWRCYPRSPSQPSSSPPWPCVSSRSWYLALGACCLLGCTRHPDQDTSPSSVFWELHCDCRCHQYV